jgi:hypothetical protein
MPEALAIPNASAEATRECSVCPHPWADHDQISARFCAATSVGHFSRGCVCTPASTHT